MVTAARLVGVVMLAIAMLFAIANQASGGDPTSCATTDCLLREIPRNRPPPLTMDDCAALDGGEASSDDDLGLVCRLRVARALAGQRAEAPCLDDDSLNPDWSMSLREPLRLRLLNDLVAAKYFAAHGITAERGGAYNNSTVHDSYVFNSFFYDDEGPAKTYMSAATYVCRSGSPAHYVPFFFVLKVNDGDDVNQGSSAQLRTLVMASVDALPFDGPHVVDQLGDLAPSDLADYDLGDVNGDGRPDLVFVEKRFSEPRFWLGVCLFEPGAERCELLEVNTALASDAFSPDPAVRVEAGRIATSLEDDGAVVAERSFAVRGGRITAD